MNTNRSLRCFALWLSIVVLLIGNLEPMNAQSASSKPSIKKKPFGTLKDGRPVDLYILTNSSGMELRVMTYGGIIQSLRVPDKKGAIDDVVLGYDALEQYEHDSPYFGSIVGRYGNRIAGGAFSLNGKQYKLSLNDGKNHLHGGKRGFDKALWNVIPAMTDDGPTLMLNYTSKDKEEGYPGTVKVSVVYTLTRSNELKIMYIAETDKPTVINLTQHSYFNLAGKGNILGHLLMIYADRFTPVDSGLIPTGELQKVEGTPFDFRKLTPIGQRIADNDLQLTYGRGYDHNFVLNGIRGEMHIAARLKDPVSGRVMDVMTTEPGLQFYSGNFLDGHNIGKRSQAYKHRYGLCLEPQHFPDSPNHPAFPSTTLLPGETYKSETIYKFLVAGGK